MFDFIAEWYQPLSAPMYRVNLMRFSATPELLPRRCVITGETKDVVFKAVYVPNQSGGWVRLTLPFTIPALHRWYMALNLFALSLGVGLIAFCASVYVAWCGGPPGVLLFAAGLVLPVLTKTILLSGSGPELLYARNDVLALMMPAQKTAEEMQTAVDGIECIMDRFVKMPVPLPVRKKLPIVKRITQKVLPNRGGTPGAPEIPAATEPVKTLPMPSAEISAPVAASSPPTAAVEKDASPEHPIKNLYADLVTSDPDTSKSSPPTNLPSGPDSPVPSESDRP